MKKLFIGIGIGGAIGSAITFFVMNKKLEKRVNEIVSKINIKDNMNDAEETNDDSKEKKDIEEYMEKAKVYDTTSEDDNAEECNDTTEDAALCDDEPIYFISEDEYVKLGDHSTETLYYYPDDNLLTDEDYNRIDDVYGYIGNCDLKDAFEKTDEHTLYIRNDNKYVDYEICRSEQLDKYYN